MKKFFVFLFMPILVASLAQARTLEVSKKDGEYMVRVVIDHNPPLANGENNIEIEIQDKEGQRVNDAEVLVNYYMPPMPRMAPMNYRTEARERKGRYYATMRFIMTGPWQIAVHIRHGGKASTFRIMVDAQ